MKILIGGADPILRGRIEGSCWSRWPNCEIKQIGDTDSLLEAIEANPPDVVLLDDRMDDDAFAICRSAREFSTVPVVILASRHENNDVIKAVDSGADFSLAMPVDESELLAIITTLVRRYKRQPLVAENRSMTVGGLYLDFENNVALLDGKPIKLTFTEQEILRTLATNANQTISSSRLSAMVWGEDVEPSVDSLKVHVKNLRQKLGESATNPRYIHSERGVGYRFVTRPNFKMAAPRVLPIKAPGCSQR